MILNRHNPDVLMCLANLSNDEVFTPPKLANQMLDTLPEELWRNPEAKFLDPFCKSGVFLREITKRLIKGLEHFEPDLQKRVNHIMEHQVYGIGITELTALMTRRSLYCTKSANGKHSVTNVFDIPEGNVAYDRIEHTFQNGKCTYCGASQEVYDRGDELETHAYQFIHNNNPFENMQFDVIIGNPPYQLSDGGGMGTSAMPLYHKFVEKAKMLNPRFLSMIIPSRWFAGGKGLDEFRKVMLNDKRLSVLVDYFDSNECFPGVDISGGICYFLWDRDYSGDCKVVTIQKENKSILRRPLLEKNSDSFIRFNDAISIIRKIAVENEPSFAHQVSPRKPFGIISSVKPKKNEFEDSVKIYAHPKSGYISKQLITQNENWVDKFKVLIAKAYGERGAFPYKVLAKPFIGEQSTCCSETYLVIGPYSSVNYVKNVISYINTKFFRLLVLLKKNTQNAARGVYQFVPLQDFSEPWTDEKLYKKYNLTQEEIDFIESMIRPME